MILITFVILSQVFAIHSAMEYTDKVDRYIIPCRSTDFTCFKLQYQLLRDNVLQGNTLLDVPDYEPYVFRYSDTGTCVKVTGLEDSELVAVNFDGKTKNFSFALSMPVRIQQVEPQNDTGLDRNCDQPDRGFGPLGLHVGPLKKFTGNATVVVSYPFRLQKRKGQIYMKLEEENLDVILDIPDLSHYDRDSELETTVVVSYPFRLQKRKGQIYMKLEEENLDVILDIPDLSHYDRDSELETKLFEWSEWAYKMVQHVDVAERTVAPYTAQVKRLFQTLPLERFILLYPTEVFSELHFEYAVYTLD